MKWLFLLPLFINPAFALYGDRESLIPYMSTKQWLYKNEQGEIQARDNIPKAKDAWSVVQEIEDLKARAMQVVDRATKSGKEPKLKREFEEYVDCVSRLDSICDISVNSAMLVVMHSCEVVSEKHFRTEIIKDYLLAKAQKKQEASPFVRQEIISLVSAPQVHAKRGVHPSGSYFELDLGHSKK